MQRTILCWLLSTVSLFAGTTWPYVDYKEVRAFAWAPQKGWNFPYEEFLQMEFGMLLFGTASTNAPLPRIDYPDSYIAYWMRPITEPSPHEWLIRPDMSFARGVIHKDGALLNAKQVGRLLKAESRRFQPRGVAGCYFPHNAFVFYDADKKPIAFLEVCFDCIGARLSPDDEGCDPDYYALAVLCTELKLPLGMFNKTAKQVRERFEFTINPAKAHSPRNSQRPFQGIPGIPSLDVGQ